MILKKLTVYRQCYKQTTQVGHGTFLGEMIKLAKYGLIKDIYSFIQKCWQCFYLLCISKQEKMDLLFFRLNFVAD